MWFAAFPDVYSTWGKILRFVKKIDTGKIILKILPAAVLSNLISNIIDKIKLFN